MSISNVSFIITDLSEDEEVETQEPGLSERRPENPGHPYIEDLEEESTDRYPERD